MDRRRATKTVDLHLSSYFAMLPVAFVPRHGRDVRRAGTSKVGDRRLDHGMRPTHRSMVAEHTPASK